MDIGKEPKQSSIDLIKKVTANFDSVITALDTFCRDEKEFCKISGHHDSNSMSPRQRHIIDGIRSDLSLHCAMMGVSKTDPVYRATNEVMRAISKGSKDLSHHAIELRRVLVEAGVSRQPPRSTSMEGVMMTVRLALEKMKADHVDATRRKLAVDLPKAVAKEAPPERKSMAFGGMGFTDMLKVLRQGSDREVADALKKAVEAEQNMRQRIAEENTVARRAAPPAGQPIQIRNGVAGAYDLGNNVEYLSKYRSAVDRKF